MKVLPDSCVWAGAAVALTTTFSPRRRDPGDEEILASAHVERRVLITVDKDFGELAIVNETPHSGILRLVDIPARQHGSVSATTLAVHGEALQSGAIVTVEAGRTRIRPAPASKRSP